VAVVSSRSRAATARAARRRSGVAGRAEVDRGGGRGGVAEIQRARMVVAMAEVAAERGAGQVTVAHVVARSGVSRRTFYELFEDREACFLAAFEEAVERARGRVIPVFRGAGSWSERIRAGLGALLEFLEDEPGLGRLCVVDALGAGPVALERRAQVVQVLIDAIDEGRSEAKGSARPTRLTAEGVVGAVLAVLHARLSERPLDRAPSMDGLLSSLMGIIALPYRGAATAAREASKSAPRRRRVAAPQRDPLRDLDMRLTYRTLRVLVAIAADPGASNRRIADAAGVTDQGQISKLLTRLEHLELIENSGGGSLRGEPNAWQLTPKGEEIEQTIRRQAAPASN
jgi:AcrR family transcriptional regulator/DNA-binding MarR family transcriptional regulator